MLPVVLGLGTLSAQEPEAPPEAPHWQVLRGRPEAERLEGFRRLTENGSRRDVPILRDLLRFVDTADEWYRILDAGTAILERDMRAVQGPWRTLTLEMAADPEWPMHDDYGAWKAELYAELVDPRMRDFFDEVDRSRIRLHEIVWGGVEVDGIPSLDDPVTLPVDQASTMSDGEPVFGVSIAGEHRAYPLRILDWHEMANDRLGGVAFALAYCTLCGAGIVYRTDVEGEGDSVRRFGSSGLLMRSNKLMFDRETRTLWNQFTGEPVLGPLVGRVEPLEVLPSVVTTWGEWRRMHPDTDVVSEETGVDREYELGASYGFYFGSEGLMFPASGRSADRFPKERVFVLRSKSIVAVPIDRIRETGVLRIDVDGGPVTLLSTDQPRDAEVPSALRGLIESCPEHASELSLDQLRSALEADRSFVESLDAEFLLSLPVAVRLPFLQAATEPPSEGDPRLSEVLRNEVALRGLSGTVFAFRGEVELERRIGSDGHASFVDSEGEEFEVTAEALLGPGGERHERVPGHLAFRFGVEAFLPTAQWR
ncbi:MAG: DUF3179 domain-containing protein [Planctomycetota bacterium]